MYLTVQCLRGKDKEHRACPGMRRNCAEDALDYLILPEEQAYDIYKEFRAMTFYPCVTVMKTACIKTLICLPVCKNESLQKVVCYHFFLKTFHSFSWFLKTGSS